MRLVVAILALALGIVACDRVVELFPAPDVTHLPDARVVIPDATFFPDAHVPNDGFGVGDAAVLDDGGVLDTFDGA